MAAKELNDSRHSKITGLLKSNSYTIVVLILTLFSLAIMALQFMLPEGTETWKLVNFYNNLTCIFFLIDFALHMIAEPRKRDYFIGQKGYFDLLGSVPSFGFSQYTALLRIFRLSRLFRLRRFMNHENRQLLKNEILNNRGSYAALLTVLMALMVISIGSIFVVFFESQSPDANITKGGDGIWWAIVTITTVGYGDRYPVTLGGRSTAVFVMFAGVGIIGALASILASLLIPQPKDKKPEDTVPADGELPLDDPKAKVAEIKALLQAQEQASANLKVKLEEIERLL